MIPLSCPSCGTAILVKKGDAYECPECEHSMSAIEYQIYFASRMQEVIDLRKKFPTRKMRRTFGRGK